MLCSPERKALGIEDLILGIGVRGEPQGVAGRVVGDIHARLTGMVEQTSGKLPYRPPCLPSSSGRQVCRIASASSPPNHANVSLRQVSAQTLRHAVQQISHRIQLISMPLHTSGFRLKPPCSQDLHQVAAQIGPKRVSRCGRNRHCYCTTGRLSGILFAALIHGLFTLLALLSAYLCLLSTPPACLSAYFPNSILSKCQHCHSCPPPCPIGRESATLAATKRMPTPTIPSSSSAPVSPASPWAPVSKKYSASTNSASSNGRPA